VAKIKVNITITSYDRFRDDQEGKKDDKKVKSISLADIRVDIGSTLTALSSKLIKRLGLKPRQRIDVITPLGIQETSLYGPVLLEIKGRTVCQDIIELVRPGLDAVVGQMTIDQMDFLIDPSKAGLSPNYEHNDQWVLEQMIIT